MHAIPPGHPQSPGHDPQVSPLLQLPSPQNGAVGGTSQLPPLHAMPLGHAQSVAQEPQFSPLLQLPSPQNGPGSTGWQ